MFARSHTTERDVRGVGNAPPKPTADVHHAIDQVERLMTRGAMPGTKKRPPVKRNHRPLIQARTSARTGATYFYGDFRSYHDVGGRVEPLRAAGCTHATTDIVIATREYAGRREHYQALREMKGEAVLGESATHVTGDGALLPSGATESTPASSIGTDDASTPRRLDDMAALHVARKGLARSGRRASTVRRDRANLAIVSRILGNPFLGDITPQSCDEFVLTREREPGVRAGTTIATRTIINELNSLGNMFHRAVAMGFVASNPVRSMAERPAITSVEAEFLAIEGASRLLDTAAELDEHARYAKEAGALRRRAKDYGDARRRGPARELRSLARQVGGPTAKRHLNVGKDCTDLEVVIATFLYTGGRHMEVVGLLIQDVDFTGGRIWFRPNKHRLLKRERHRREVPLWPPLRALLSAYLRRTGLWDAAPDTLLFSGKRGKMMVNFGKPFGRCARAAGLHEGERKVTPHTLRHTYATQLLQTLVRTENGQLAMRSSFDVAKRLGHRSSALVDDTYGHLVPNPAYRETLSYEGGRRLPAARLEA
jgi:integrase